MGVGSMGKFGSGGTSAGRPMAIISVDPNGNVTVRPVLDPKKSRWHFSTSWVVSCWC